MLKLTVLSRSYCHLCDDMIAALENFRGRFSLTFEFQVVDIDQQPALEAKWGEKVPVLMEGDGSGEHEICHYFFDEASIIGALSTHDTNANLDATVAAGERNRLK